MHFFLNFSRIDSPFHFLRPYMVKSDWPILDTFKLKFDHFCQNHSAHEEYLGRYPGLKVAIS